MRRSIARIDPGPSVISRITNRIAAGLTGRSEDQADMASRVTRDWSAMLTVSYGDGSRATDACAHGYTHVKPNNGEQTDYGGDAMVMEGNPNVEDAAKRLKDHLKDLEEKKLIDLAEQRRRRDREEERHRTSSSRRNQ